MIMSPLTENPARFVGVERPREVYSTRYEC